MLQPIDNLPILNIFYFGALNPVNLNIEQTQYFGVLEVWFRHGYVLPHRLPWVRRVTSILEQLVSHLLHFAVGVLDHIPLGPGILGHLLG